LNITAERQFLDFLKKQDKDELDAYNLIVSHSKGIERLLDDHITNKYFETLNEKYGEPYPNDVLDNLPKILKEIKISRFKTTLTPVQWSRTLNQNRRWTDSILNFINQTFNSELPKEIKKFSSLTKNLRNPGSHSEPIDFQAIKKLRPKVIKSMNNIISYIYESN
jgi:hypothetical protein